MCNAILPLPHFTSLSVQVAFQFMRPVFISFLFLINTDVAIPLNRRGRDNAAFLSDNIFVIFHIWQNGLNIVVFNEYKYRFITFQYK